MTDPQARALLDAPDWLALAKQYRAVVWPLMENDPPEYAEAKGLEIVFGRILRAVRLKEVALSMAEVPPDTVARALLARLAAARGHAAMNTNTFREVVEPIVREAAALLAAPEGEMPVGFPAGEFVTERYWCGCIRESRWVPRCERHTELEHDEEPMTQAQEAKRAATPPAPACWRSFRTSRRTAMKPSRDMPDGAPSMSN